MEARSSAAPVPLDHYGQSVQCLICHCRGAAHYQALAWRPADQDARRNSMAIVVWVCDECAEAVAGAVAASRTRGPVAR
ncbi:MAG: hypothetical protein ACYCT1_08415 [Steroidobacteraceae bacterium]